MQWGRVNRLLVILAALSGAVGCSRSGEIAADPERDLRIKATCAEAGKKARQRWIARYPSETFTNNPEYRYSSTLKTCLYADEYIDVYPGKREPLLADVKSRRDRFVLDVYSGKVLVEYTEHDGKSIQDKPDDVLCRTEHEFEERKARLFGNGGR